MSLACQGAAPSTLWHSTQWHSPSIQNRLQINAQAVVSCPWLPGCFFLLCCCHLKAESVTVVPTAQAYVIYFTAILYFRNRFIQ